MNVLLYGNSQSGGMGVAVEKALKKAGHTVKRVTRNGADDGDLLAYLTKLPDPAQFDRTVLYAGGNSSKPDPTKIDKLVSYFGTGRTVVVLPPINLDHPDPVWRENRRATATANAAGLKSTSKVFLVEAPGKSFQTDHVHMLSTAPEAQAMALNIVNAMPSELGTPAIAANPKTLGIVAVGVLAVVLWKSWRPAATRRFVPS